MQHLFHCSCFLQRFYFDSWFFFAVSFDVVIVLKDLLHIFPPQQLLLSVLQFLAGDGGFKYIFKVTLATLKCRNIFKTNICGISHVCMSLTAQNPDLVFHFSTVAIFISSFRSLTALTAIVWLEQEGVCFFKACHALVSCGACVCTNILPILLCCCGDFFVCVCVGGGGGGIQVTVCVPRPLPQQLAAEPTSIQEEACCLKGLEVSLPSTTVQQGFSLALCVPD